MRRWFAALAVALGLCAPTYATQRSSVDSLVELLRQHPDVDHVDRCGPANASETILQLRQLHFGPPLAQTYTDQYGTAQEKQLIRGITKTIYEEINENQKRLYQVMTTLVDAGYQNIHVEGVPIEHISAVTLGPMGYLYADRLQTLRDADLIPEQDEPFIRGLRQAAGFVLQDEGAQHIIVFSPEGSVVTNTPPASFARYRFIPGAELIHYREGHITIQPFEREHLFSISHCTDDDRVKMDAREDAAIEIMQSYDEPVHIVILGADHALGGPQSCPTLDLSERVSFVDNIDEANQHSQKSVALVEVTVKGLDAFVREYHRLYKEVVGPTITTIAQRKAAKQWPKANIITIRGCGPELTIE